MSSTAELPARAGRDLLAQTPETTVRIVPSRVFSATFPVNPSATITSRARPRAAASLGVAPELEACARRSSACASSVSWLPFSCSSPIESSRTRGSLDLEDLLGEDGAHVAELEEVLGAGIGVGAGVDQHRRRRLRVGITTAIAGRWTPGVAARGAAPRRASRPVLPADTTASATPSPTARTARTSDESGLARTASAGLSSISITPSVTTCSSPPGSIVGRAEEDRRDRVTAGVDRARNDLDGRVVAPEGVDRDPDGHRLDDWCHGIVTRGAWAGRSRARGTGFGDA